MKRLPVVVLVLSAILLFARLGRYALWDDEAGTALTARGILATGDTSAELGRNLFAYHDGAELENRRLRYMPPLQAYLAAPSLAALGRDSALAARLPFAACALSAVALMLFWLRRARADAVETAVFAAALLGNVSFFLYGRQARYYAPVLLCTTAVAYLYAFRDGTRRRAAWISFWSIAVLALNYLSFAAMTACLAVDYALWGRAERPLRREQWVWLLAPQAAAAALLLSVWSPFGKHAVETVAGAWWTDTAASLWYAIRDTHRCEFLSWPLLLAAPLLYRVRRDPWLLRAPLAALVYVAAVAALSPLPASGPRVAQVRYLVPLIPLGLAVAALCARAAPPRARRLVAPLTLVFFGANGLTLRDFARELASPPADPYSVAARWINENVKEGESVLVAPDHMTYPLMFHAPKAVYAWQLSWPARPQFEGLAEIHFRGRVQPDYAVAFGPAAEPVARGLGPGYERVATLDAYWRDLYRPELFWRRSSAVTGYDKNTEAIYVLRRRPRAARL